MFVVQQQYFIVETDSNSVGGNILGVKIFHSVLLQLLKDDKSSVEEIT